MEEKNKKCSGGDCGNGGCGCGGACSCGGGMRAGMCGCKGGVMRHDFLIRIVIMIAILGFVFWSGIKIGELKLLFSTSPMMDGRGGIYGR